VRGAAETALAADGEAGGHFAVEEDYSSSTTISF
jgi:hypothetical protein